jgi:hypothetical protein
MSWVVENLQNQLKEMVLRKTDIKVELYDLDESIKVLGNLIEILSAPRSERTTDNACNTMTDNPYPTSVYVE